MDAAKQRQLMDLMSEYRTEEATTGSWLAREDKRHTDNLDLFEAMLREAYGDVTMVIAGHHIMAVRQGQTLPVEVAAPDTLIFDHFIAQKVWKEGYREVLARLAIEPAGTRDALLRQLYNARSK